MVFDDRTEMESLFDNFRISVSHLFDENLVSGL